MSFGFTKTVKEKWLAGHKNVNSFASKELSAGKGQAAAHKAVGNKQVAARRHGAPIGLHDELVKLGKATSAHEASAQQDVLNTRENSIPKYSTNQLRKAQAQTFKRQSTLQKQNKTAEAEAAGNHGRLIGRVLEDRVPSIDGASSSAPSRTSSSASEGSMLSDVAEQKITRLEKQNIELEGEVKKLKQGLVTRASHKLRKSVVEPSKTGVGPAYHSLAGAENIAQAGLRAGISHAVGHSAVALVGVAAVGVTGAVESVAEGAKWAYHQKKAVARTLPGVASKAERHGNERQLVASATGKKHSELDRKTVKSWKSGFLADIGLQGKGEATQDKALVGLQDALNARGGKAAEAVVRDFKHDVNNPIKVKLNIAESAKVGLAVDEGAANPVRVNLGATSGVKLQVQVPEAPKTQKGALKSAVRGLFGLGKKRQSAAQQA